MPDIVDTLHESAVHRAFARTCELLGMHGFTLRPLRRRARGVGRFRSFRYGYTSLREKAITVDFYTTKTVKPRKMDALIRVICHELTHHIEPPRRMRYRGRIVNASHHPHFWQCYKKNVALCTADPELSNHFTHAESSAAS